MYQLVDPSLMPVATKDVWDCKCIDYLTQQEPGSIGPLRQFRAELEVPLHRDACRGIVGDEYVERAAGNQPLSLLKCGFLVRPPVLALGPVLVVHAEGATQAANGQTLHYGATTSGQDLDIGPEGRRAVGADW